MYSLPRAPHIPSCLTNKRRCKEIIAEHLKRPLFAISWRTLNEDWTVEDQFSEYFLMARHWNAVILVQEADVLFGKREQIGLTAYGTGISRCECISA